jgi:hypothetical protein
MVHNLKLPAGWQAEADGKSQMKAIDRPFTKIINGITQFVIPVFQCDYSWTEDRGGMRTTLEGRDRNNAEFFSV